MRFQVPPPKGPPPKWKPKQSTTAASSKTEEGDGDDNQKTTTTTAVTNPWEAAAAAKSPPSRSPKPWESKTKTEETTNVKPPPWKKAVPAQSPVSPKPWEKKIPTEGWFVKPPPAAAAKPGSAAPVKKQQVPAATAHHQSVSPKPWEKPVPVRQYVEGSNETVPERRTVRPWEQKQQQQQQQQPQPQKQQQEPPAAGGGQVEKQRRIRSKDKRDQSEIPQEVSLDITTPASITKEVPDEEDVSSSQAFDPEEEAEIVKLPVDSHYYVESTNEAVDPKLGHPVPVRPWEQHSGELVQLGQKGDTKQNQPTGNAKPTEIITSTVLHDIRAGSFNLIGESPNEKKSVQEEKEEEESGETEKITNLSPEAAGARAVRTSSAPSGSSSKRATAAEALRWSTQSGNHWEEEVFDNQEEEAGNRMPVIDEEAGTTSRRSTTTDDAIRWSTQSGNHYEEEVMDGNVVHHQRGQGDAAVAATTAAPLDPPSPMEDLRKSLKQDPIGRNSQTWSNDDEEMQQQIRTLHAPVYDNQEEGASDPQLPASPGQQQQQVKTRGSTTKASSKSRRDKQLANNEELQKQLANEAVQKRLADEVTKRQKAPKEPRKQKSKSSHHTTTRKTRPTQLPSDFLGSPEEPKQIVETVNLEEQGSRGKDDWQVKGAKLAAERDAKLATLKDRMTAITPNNKNNIHTVPVSGKKPLENAIRSGLEREDGQPDPDLLKAAQEGTGLPRSIILNLVKLAKQMEREHETVKLNITFTGKKKKKRTNNANQDNQEWDDNSAAQQSIRTEQEQLNSRMVRLVEDNATLTEQLATDTTRLRTDTRRLMQSNHDLYEQVEFLQYRTKHFQQDIVRIQQEHEQSTRELEAQLAASLRVVTQPTNRKQKQVSIQPPTRKSASLRPQKQPSVQTKTPATPPSTLPKAGGTVTSSLTGNTTTKHLQHNTTRVEQQSTDEPKKNSQRVVKQSQRDGKSAAWWQPQQRPPVQQRPTTAPQQSALQRTEDAVPPASHATGVSQVLVRQIQSVDLQRACPKSAIGIALMLLSLKVFFVAAFTLLVTQTKCNPDTSLINGNTRPDTLQSIFRYEGHFLCHSEMQKKDLEEEEWVDCILSGFHCTDYGSSHCPEEVFVCDPSTTPVCAGMTSVTSITCPLVATTIGSSMGFLDLLEVVLVGLFVMAWNFFVSGREI